MCAYVYVHSRSISFLSWCLIQRGVGDCGQPVRQRYQFEQTEASTVNARYSELLDLPDLYGQLSSSVSKSLEYSIKNVLISTVSNTSSGSSLSLHRKQTLQHAFNFVAERPTVFLTHSFHLIILIWYKLTVMTRGSQWVNEFFTERRVWCFHLLMLTLNTQLQLKVSEMVNSPVDYYQM